MKDISSFFDKFKNLIKADGAEKQALSDALNDCLGIRIDPKQIEVRKGIAYIPSSSVMKNELFIKKKAILEKVAAHTSVKDIR